jgi:hypothetical protein
MRFVLTGLLTTFLLTPWLSAAPVAERTGGSRIPTVTVEGRLLQAATDKESEHESVALASDLRAAAGSLITLLPNGDFESGASVWTEASLNSWPLILDSSGLPEGVAPHGGNWATWLGGDHDEIAYIEQQLTVPLGSPVLRYWHWIDSEDDCGWDFAGVIVNSTTVVHSYDLCWQVDTGGWVLYGVDMRAWAGLTVDLQIRIETDDQLTSNLFVDDVFFESDESLIFGDGFESGNLSSWSNSTP